MKGVTNLLSLNFTVIFIRKSLNIILYLLIQVKKELIDKQIQLKNILEPLDKAVISYSGGLDSSFLLAFSHEILGENTVAVTINSPLTPLREFDDAKEFTTSRKIKHKIINIQMNELDTIIKNEMDRCYHCKKLIFEKILDYANQQKISYILDGSNYDDLKDFRPGMKALRELRIKSPMIEAGLKKEDIRILSKQMGLKSWNKPSMACLASRFPYNTTITTEALDKIEKSESYIQSLGIGQVRIRYYEEHAKIEVLKEDFNLIIKNSKKIVEFMKKHGFNTITLDLKGYRTGSLNEDL